MISSGKFADFLISRNIISNLTSQKFLNGIDSYGPALGLICLPFSGCNQMVVVAILSACVGCGFLVRQYMFLHFFVVVNLICTNLTHNI